MVEPIDLSDDDLGLPLTKIDSLVDIRAAKKILDSAGGVSLNAAAESTAAHVAGIISAEMKIPEACGLLSGIELPKGLAFHVSVTDKFGAQSRSQIDRDIK